MKIRVLHTDYGPDTGCCGHVIEVDGEEVGAFHFSHPNSNKAADVRAFVEDLITKQLGAAHLADIDWKTLEVMCD